MFAVLQFDSTSVPLVERMVAAGRLPALAAARDRGHRYEFDPGSTPLFPSAAYPTLYSGREIADHGIYSAFPWFPAEQRVRFMRSMTLPRSVWELLPPGRRALVIDPYDHWPPSAGEGVFVSGWQYRNRVAALERWSVPAGAHRRLSRRFGAPPLLEDAYGAQPARRLLEARHRLLAAPARVSALVRDLLVHERFDLVWATFSAGHFAGHFLWDTSQIADGDAVSQAEQTMLARTVEEVYEAVDRAIGEILDALADDADVIVLSPIGMGPFTSRADMLPELLEAVLEGRADGAAAGSSMFRLRASVPSSLRAAVARVLPSRAVHELAARLYLQGVDWSRTRAIALPGEQNGYVRLNLRGRDQSTP
jgi:predicted AlkP superfamily phosphohydrolase/phosphomutase